jgi:choline kinase
MRAIILSADWGGGAPLQQPPGEESPKCLLRFDGVTLLERHLHILEAAGVEDIVLALGFRPEKVNAELDRLGRRQRPEIVLNPRYNLGSMLTVHTVAEPLTRGGDVLLMDADVLYDPRILHALVAGNSVNRLLIDREFEAGEEPVKVCLKNGVPVEFRKRLVADLEYDTIGESVGFFPFREDTASRLAEIVAGYIANGRWDLPHEEAVRDLLLETSHAFDVADVTGMPWLEIDFPGDIARAHDQVLPRIQLSLAQSSIPWSECTTLAAAASTVTAPSAVHPDPFGVAPRPASNLGPAD